VTEAGRAFGDASTGLEDKISMPPSPWQVIDSRTSRGASRPSHRSATGAAFIRTNAPTIGHASPIPGGRRSDAPAADHPSIVPSACTIAFVTGRATRAGTGDDPASTNGVAVARASRR
jgi:hypothetical protein